MKINTTIQACYRATDTAYVFNSRILPKKLIHAVETNSTLLSGLVSYGSHQAELFKEFGRPSGLDVVANVLNDPLKANTNSFNALYEMMSIAMLRHEASHLSGFVQDTPEGELILNFDGNYPIQFVAYRGPMPLASDFQIAMDGVDFCLKHRDYQCGFVELTSAKGSATRLYPSRSKEGIDGYISVTGFYVDPHPPFSQFHLADSFEGIAYGGFTVELLRNDMTSVKRLCNGLKDMDAFLDDNPDLIKEYGRACID